MSKFVIISPCYNEEKLVLDFLTELEKTLLKTSHVFTVIMVDDCSTDSSLEKLLQFKFQSSENKYKIIRLGYNIGHQGAIKQGIRYARKFDADGYIVIDADGEDDPEAILKLVEQPLTDIMFVSRGKRTQSVAFKIAYFLYKILFKIISGVNINFGNYSIISKRVFDSICMQDFDHYSAFLSRSKYRKGLIKFDRRRRIDGVSKMKFNDLVFHGLKSLIEYSEELMLFFIRILFLLFIFFLGFGGYVLYGKFISHEAIPGWTSNIALGLINSMLITAGIIVIGLLILSQKNRSKSYKDIFTEYNSQK